MAKVVVVERYRVVADGLEALLRRSGAEQIEHLCIAKGIETVAQLGSVCVVLVGPYVSLAEAGEILATVRQASTGAHAIVIRPHLSSAEAFEVREQGITGILSLAADADALQSCLAFVLAGSPWVDPQLASEAFWGPTATNPNNLTSRENEIVSLVSRGLRNKEIARKLNVSEGTIKMHLHHVFAKLRLASRTQLLLQPQVQELAAAAYHARRTQGEKPLAS